MQFVSRFPGVSTSFWVPGNLEPRNLETYDIINQNTCSTLFYGKKQGIYNIVITYVSMVVIGGIYSFSKKFRMEFGRQSM